MTFIRYMHVERLAENNTEIDGILDGKIYVYPKLDGSNHCVWWDDDRGAMRCASRNQVLTSEYDSTKFVHTYVIPNMDKLEFLVRDNMKLTFYGEFMRPHVIKDYYNDVWDDWYVFDVVNQETGKWMSFEEYQPILEQYNISYIPPMKVLENPTREDLDACVNNNHFMMQDDCLGEGIVIKNYDFVNRYGRTTWAKIVREEFKVMSKATPAERGEETSIESKLVNNYLSPEYIEKEYYKFIDDRGEWNDRMIPGLIQHVMFEWWKDYSYDVIATLKKPIDMGSFRKHMAKKIVGKVKRMQK